MELDQINLQRREKSSNKWVVLFRLQSVGFFDTHYAGRGRRGVPERVRVCL